MVELVFLGLFFFLFLPGKLSCWNVMHSGVGKGVDKLFIVSARWKPTKLPNRFSV